MDSQAEAPLDTCKPAAADTLAALQAEVLLLKRQLQQRTQANYALRKRLRRRQEFVQQLTQAIPSALYLYHIGTKRLVFINDQLGTLLNYSQEEIRELKPKLLKTLLHPYDKQRMKMHYNNVVKAAEGSILQAEVRLLSKEGRWKWVRVYHSVLARDAQGNARQLMGSLQDISDEKHWLKKLTWQKGFYENILNNIPAHISVFNPEHVYLFVNPREIHNAHINKWIIGKDDFAYCRALNRDISVAKNRHAKFTESVRQKKEVVWEDISLNENKEKIYYLRKFYPVLNEAGNVAYVIGYSVDITQRRKAEEQLANQQELVRQVIESTPNPIYVKDENGRFVLANAAYARLYGVSAVQILAKQHNYSFSHSRDLKMLQATDMVSFEEAYKLPDQTTIWLHTIKKPFVRPDGTRYLLTISSDITDLNRSKMAAEDSARAKQVFLANMSHEIRTPMNGILGLARLMKKGFITQDQAKYLDIIISSTENLLTIINDILDFAKIESGKIYLEKIPFSISSTIEETAKSLVFLAAEKGLMLRTAIGSPDIPTVEGDPFRLRQILVNLVNNAIKFTHAGQITVGVDISQETDQHITLQFCVEDTGIGISPDKFEQIFSSFDQAYSNTSRLYGGTGLGLSICKNLVELQKGSIWLDSQPGQGSRFYFSLSYPISSHPPYKEASGHSFIPGLMQGLRVLLVEDNSVNKLLANSLLQSWEVAVDVASDGEEALRKATSNRYDLILMDIQMPQMNGLEATAHLRHTENLNQSTPIIALTANAMKNEVESYVHLGFTDYLVKPYHEHDLYRIIALHSGRDDQEPSATTPGGEHVAAGYNFSQLGKLASNPEFIRKMQALFIETVPAQLQQLREAVSLKEHTTAYTLTHTLKSTYGNLQMEDAVQCIRQLEQVLKASADSAQLMQLVEVVEQITERMVKVFREQLLIQ